MRLYTASADYILRCDQPIRAAVAACRSLRRYQALSAGRDPR